MLVIAKGKSIKSSVQKLNIVADLIRGIRVSEAVVQLKFCKRQYAAKALGDVLRSAISNAQNNHGMDIDSLYVNSVLLGKSRCYKRHSVRGRGRINRVIKWFSNATVCVGHKGKEDVVWVKK